MNKKILIIDNDLFFSARIADQIKKMGFETVTEGDARNVLDKARSGISAVIINLSMRNADSVGIVRSLKSDPGTDSIPILAFGSHKNAALFEAAKSAGCEMTVANSALSSALPDFIAQATEDKTNV